MLSRYDNVFQYEGIGYYTVPTALVIQDEGLLAQEILNQLINQYPILTGATVSFGDANGYQAICYYSSGRIIINPNHTATLQRILEHEVWHIIDYRDNGIIDWQENIPPVNMSDYQN